METRTSQLIGDDNKNVITSWNQIETTHTYLRAGIYSISIIGQIIGWSFNGGGDRLKFLVIEEWNELRLGNSGGYFRGCENLKITASDELNLTGTTTLDHTFQYCNSLDVVNRMNEWDVSSVKDISYIFRGASSFNQPISNWNVSNVKNMGSMFSHAISFNQSIGSWNVSNVEDMTTMFQNARSFNQSIGTLDISSVFSMNSMFQNGHSFNQPIGTWDVSLVLDMS